jgi:hypothetical protein
LYFIRKPSRRSAQRVDEFSCNNDVFRRGKIYRVHQRVAAEIRVNKRDDTDYARYTKPNRHIFRAIWHDQTDDIAFCDTMP